MSFEEEVPELSEELKLLNGKIDRILSQMDRILTILSDGKQPQLKPQNPQKYECPYCGRIFNRYQNKYWHILFKHEKERGGIEK